MVFLSPPATIPPGASHDSLRYRSHATRDCRLVDLSLALDGSLQFGRRAVRLPDLGAMLALDDADQRDLLLHLSSRDLAAWWRACGPSVASYHGLRLTGVAAVPGWED